MKTNSFSEQWHSQHERTQAKLDHVTQTIERILDSAQTMAQLSEADIQPIRKQAEVLEEVWNDLRELRDDAEKQLAAFIEDNRNFLQVKELLLNIGAKTVTENDPSKAALEAAADELPVQKWVVEKRKEFCADVLGAIEQTIAAAQRAKMTAALLLTEVSPKPKSDASS